MIASGSEYNKLYSELTYETQSATIELQLNK